jgi:hypothetical protein
MYVSECGFMTMINQMIQFRSALPIENRIHEDYYRVLDMVLQLYNSAGFHIKTIHCDGKFRAMMDKVKDDLRACMDFTNALDHVPEAERNNRTIKEQVRAAYHWLPYKALLRQLIRNLVQTQASQLNLFLAKGGISPYYSPRTILGLPTLDYAKHCMVPFGAYMQANHETNQTNSNASRTLDAIYLRPVNSMQGGHEQYDLNSGRVITRARVTQIPITDMVIKAIECIADNQGFKSLKFKNQKGAIFHNADWIAGVDSDENIQQEDDNDKAYDKEDNEDPDEDIEDDQYNQIDKDELEDLNEDAREEDNPNQHQEQDKIEHDNQDKEESKDEGTAIISKPELDSQTSEVRRSTRTSRPVEKLKPNMSGKLYVQNHKKKRRVSFAEDKLRQLEYCHNLVAQVKPDEEMNIEYGSKSNAYRKIHSGQNKHPLPNNTCCKRDWRYLETKRTWSIKEGNWSTTQENLFCTI